MTAGALTTSDLLALGRDINVTLLNWTSSNAEPACSWTGVVDCQTPLANGTQYFGLDLHGLQLEGQLQAAWALLPSFSEGLVSLNLSSNKIKAGPVVADQLKLPPCGHSLSSPVAAGLVAAQPLQPHRAHQSRPVGQCHHGHARGPAASPGPLAPAGR